MNEYKFVLSDYLNNSALQFSDKIAIVCGKYQYTYAQILLFTDKLSAHFYFLGLKKGDRVLISTGNSVMTIIAFWAALRSGGIASIIHPKTPNKHFEYILKDSSPSILVSLKDQERITSKRTHIISVEMDSFDANFFDGLEQEKNLHKTLVLDLDLACILYTSGSTGEPKGVMLNHRNMLSASVSINQYLKYKSEDRVLCALPISFDYGLYQMILAFLAGATLYLESDFQFPLKTLKLISSNKITIFPIVSSMVPILYSHYRRFSYDLTSIRCITNTGSALNVRHVDMINEVFPMATIYSMYGLTECKRCTYLPPEKLAEKPNSVGVPIPNLELWVADEKGERVKANEIGEIVIRGATVMQGYWNKPEITAEKLRPGSWPGEKILYTGDYGWLDEEGFLYLHGRGDEILKTRGVKVSLLEIESILLKMPAIKEVAVIGIEDEVLGSAISVFMITDGLASISEIRQFCLENLEPEKIPQSFRVVSCLPRNSNGKIDKSLLKRSIFEDRA